MPKIETATIEDAELIFLNFMGREGTYNRAGVRNFCVLIDQDNAEAMAANGWNIKYLRPKEEGDVPTPYLPVEVSYKNKPPYHDDYFEGSSADHRGSCRNARCG